MTAPSAPVIYARTDGEKIRVRWQPVSGAVDYNLYVDNVATPTTVYGNYPVTYSSDWYQATFLASDDTYFRLTARNAGAEESGYSNELKLSPRGPGVSRPQRQREGRLGDL